MDLIYIEEAQPDDAPAIYDDNDRIQLITVNDIPEGSRNGGIDKNRIFIFCL